MNSSTHKNLSIYKLLQILYMPNKAELCFQAFTNSMIGSKRGNLDSLSFLLALGLEISLDQPQVLSINLLFRDRSHPPSNDSSHLLSICCVPGTMLSNLHAFFHLSLKRNLYSICCVIQSCFKEKIAQRNSCLSLPSQMAQELPMQAI